jgi:hypothetical protein
MIADQDARGQLWESWTPTVGDRVRVRISGECPLHNAPDYPLQVDGLVGTILADTRRESSVLVRHDPEASAEATSSGHWWFVRLDQTVGIYRGRRINCDDFCTAELEPLEAADVSP